MSTRSLPTPPPENPAETPTELSTEGDHATPPVAGAEDPTTDPQEAQPQPITIYTDIFHNIANRIIDKDWSGLTTFAEFYDLYHHDNTDTSRLMLTIPLTLSYLILDDIPPARFALTRLPPPLLHHSLAEGLFKLVASTSERDYPQVYIRAVALLETLNTEIDLHDFGTSMVIAFIDSFRNRAFKLISKAYTSIPVSLAESYLGLTRDELLPTVAKCKWKHDPATDILTPARLLNTSARHVQGIVSGPSTLLTFDVVTNGVALLES